MSTSKASSGADFRGKVTELYCCKGRIVRGGNVVGFVCGCKYYEFFFPLMFAVYSVFFSYILIVVVYSDPFIYLSTCLLFLYVCLDVYLLFSIRCSSP